MDQRVTLVTLGVSDLAGARAFYEAIGWTTRAADGDDVVFFQAGGMVVALWDRAGARGGRRDCAEPAETFWGGYSGVFVDPAGHPWEVAHNPRWTLGPDGSVTLPH